MKVLGYSHYAFGIAHQYFVVVAVQLYQQVGIHILRELGGNFGGVYLLAVVYGFHGGFALKELHARRCYAGAEYFGNSLAGFFVCYKGEQQRYRLLRQSAQLEYYFGNDAQRAFAAAHKLREVVAGRVFEYVGAGPDYVARRKHHFQVQHIVACNAVFYCLGAATVFRYIAAYKAGAAAGRIRRVEEALFFFTAFWNISVITPGSTVACKLSSSMLSMRLKRSMEITTPLWMGSAPPLRLSAAAAWRYGYNVLAAELHNSADLFGGAGL